MANSADELALTVKDENLAIEAKYEHKAREVRDDTLLDCLLNMDSLLQFECALLHFPYLDAELLDSQEFDCIREVDLR